MKKSLIAVLILIASINSLIADSNRDIIQSFLNANQKDLNLLSADIQSWRISDSHTDSRNGIEFIYIQQHINGIPIQNSQANFAIKNGKILHAGNRLKRNTLARKSSLKPSLTPQDAIRSVISSMNLGTLEDLVLLEEQSENKFLFSKAGVSLENIPVQLMYYHTKDGMRLVWNLSIYEKSAENWWSCSVDAETGQLLNKVNWVNKCEFGHFHIENEREESNKQNSTSKKLTGGQYRVFELPLESPNHGPRSMAVNPSDSIASPYGWHDTNGQSGEEFTITRGNNVFAYEDANNTNSAGFSPDGGASLIFDYPFIPGTSPSTYQSAAITNLFYLNNKMHDIWYQYGFDEASGNFQVNNYGNGGTGGDEVNAEAQDGGGTNNANFATPPDGSNPRMQMYIWTNNSGVDLTVNSPATIAGTYSAVEATFGPGLSSPISADLILVNDATLPNPNDACDPLINGPAINGKIAVIDRGDCTFVSKIQLAQNAGAIAVVMINNIGGGPIAMGGSSAGINIPSVMISLNDGNLIKNEMSNGTVNITLNPPSTNGDIDGDFDNGIIAHEYGHGISTRLTGGRLNSGCLQSAEQMGEGWSDWFGLMITIDSGDQGSDIRGIGTFAVNQPTNGNGIRPAPYSTDFNINNYTYAATNNSAISQPHGLGFVYATALWDLNWALINQYGGVPDPDIYYGTGGNNIAMDLVITSLKLQPCNPGMLDGRDAILAADQLLYNGAHRCLIWNVFANRGFGFSASQGSPNNRFDQVEAFDLPPFCQTATVAPTADFTFNPAQGTCESSINFTDASINTPQNWRWDFGDGNTDTTYNPSHVYSSPGVYTVKMVVSNTIGSDSIVKNVTINKPQALSVADKEVCFGLNAILLASNNLGTVQWYDQSNNFVSSGNLFIDQNVTTDKVFYVRDFLSSTCSSDFDTVNIKVVKSDFTYNQNLSVVSFTDASLGATSWLWDFGDGNTSTSQNPIHSYSNTGIYNVRLSLNGGPCQSSQSLDIIAGLPKSVQNKIKIYPNPVNESLNIKFKDVFASKTLVSFENIQGSVIETFEIPAGEQFFEIDVKEYSPAIYLLRIKNASINRVEKLIID